MRNISAEAIADIWRESMHVAAAQVVDICDGTPAAHDAMRELCRLLAAGASGEWVEPTQGRLAWLSAATELARVGARILRIDPDSTPPRITVDPSRMHWVRQPALFEGRAFSLSLNGARVEWTCWP